MTECYMCIMCTTAAAHRQAEAGAVAGRGGSRQYLFYVHMYTVPLLEGQCVLGCGAPRDKGVGAVSRGSE